MKIRLLSFLSDYKGWLLLLVGLFLLQAVHPIDSDEGVILNGAWNLMHGRQLYKGFFEFVPPGGFVFLAGVWKISGVSYLSARLASLVVVIISAIGLERIAKYLGAGKWSLVAPGAFILSAIFWVPINHNAFALAPAIWSAYFFLRSLTESHASAWYRSNLFYSGLLAGFTGWFLQHKGVAMAGAGIIYLLIMSRNPDRWRNLLILGVGLMLPILAMLCFWSPALLYQQLIAFPFRNYHETNAVALTYWWNAVILAIIISWAVKPYLKKTTYTYLLLLQVALLLAALPRPDISHCLQALWPLFIFMALALGKAVLHPIIRRLTIFGLIIFFVGSVITFLPRPFLERPNASLRAVAERCPTIYSGPFLPSLYFEMRRLNPLPYSILITGQQTPEQFAESARLLKASPPACVFLNYALVSKFGYTKANPVDEFIAGQYARAGVFGSIHWYLPN